MYPLSFHDLIHRMHQLKPQRLPRTLQRPSGSLPAASPMKPLSVWSQNFHIDIEQSLPNCSAIFVYLPVWTWRALVILTPILSAVRYSEKYIVGCASKILHIALSILHHFSFDHAGFNTPSHSLGTVLVRPSISLSERFANLLVSMLCQQPSPTRERVRVGVTIGIGSATSPRHDA